MSFSIAHYTNHLCSPCLFCILVLNGYIVLSVIVVIIFFFFFYTKQMKKTVTSFRVHFLSDTC